LKGIVEASHHGAEIVKNVRSMFKKEETQEKAALDINERIRSVLALIYFDLRKHSIEARISLGEHLPPVLGNSVQLQQVILNLMMNAIEAMSSTEPRVLSIKSELIRNDLVRVTVEDTGSGIKGSKVNDIFTPLYTTKARGMGMGLSICRSIIEEHGGKIWATPSATRGMIFQFELPVSVQRSAQPPDWPSTIPHTLSESPTH
jgi:C4-dicarboxylate-specific signal transduction histidine kinase